MRIDGYDKEFLAAIDRALEVFPDDRFQSAEDWIAAIEDCLARQRAAVQARNDDPMLRAISEMIAIGKASQTPAEAMPPAPRPVVPTRRLTEGLAPGDDDRRFVDIFGNPVEDVDAWHADQERILKRQRAAIERPAAAAPEQPEIRGGFLRSLLGLKPPQPVSRVDN
jgi:hypothetical protein